MSGTFDTFFMTHNKIYSISIGHGKDMFRPPHTMQFLPLEKTIKSVDLK